MALYFERRTYVELQVVDGVVVQCPCLSGDTRIWVPFFKGVETFVPGLSSCTSIKRYCLRFRPKYSLNSLRVHIFFSLACSISSISMARMYAGLECALSLSVADIRISASPRSSNCPLAGSRLRGTWPLNREVSTSINGMRKW